VSTAAIFAEVGEGDAAGPAVAGFSTDVRPPGGIACRSIGAIGTSGIGAAVAREHRRVLRGIGATIVEGAIDLLIIPVETEHPVAASGRRQP
jgi:hypothetical protein